MPPLPIPSDYFIPIVLGATGHRDLRPEDIEPLKRAVRGVFENLQTSYPHSGLILFSALAEGADRLVADVALSMPRRIELIVPFPLPLDDYMHDFKSPESKQEFLSLLRRAS